MTLRPRRLVPAVRPRCRRSLIAVLSLYRPPLFASLDTAPTTPSCAPRSRPPGGRIVIVDVDERSLAAFGQWPWRRDRDRHADRPLRELGAAVVALDIIFAESDRYDGAGVTPDEALADALRAGRRGASATR